MDREQLEQMTRDDLYEAASAADVAGRSAMSKGELVDALADDRTTGIDPAMVDARDALRAAEADAAAAVEDRPKVGGIDDQLVAARKQTIAADAASETSATVAPSGA